MKQDKDTDLLVLTIFNLTSYICVMSVFMLLMR